MVQGVRYALSSTYSYILALRVNFDYNQHPVNMGRLVLITSRKSGESAVP